MTKFPLRKIETVEWDPAIWGPVETLECGHQLPHIGDSKSGKRRCWKCPPLPATRPPRRW